MLSCVCTFLFKQLFHLLYSNASYNNVHKKSLWSLQEAFTTKYDMGRNPFLKSFETLNGSLWCVLCAFFCVCSLLFKEKEEEKKRRKSGWLSLHLAFCTSVFQYSHNSSKLKVDSHSQWDNSLYFLQTLLWSWKYECVKLDICYHRAIHLCNINFETTQHKRFYKGKKKRKKIKRKRPLTQNL